MSPASKIRIIAEPVFEVALLDAVDGRLVEEPRGAIDPAAATSEVAFEPEALGEPRAEVRRTVHAPSSMQRWCARAHTANPSSSWPVR